MKPSILTSTALELLDRSNKATYFFSSIEMRKEASSCLSLQCLVGHMSYVSASHRSGQSYRTMLYSTDFAVLCLLTLDLILFETSLALRDSISLPQILLPHSNENCYFHIFPFMFFAFFLFQELRYQRLLFSNCLWSLHQLGWLHKRHTS